MKEMSMCAHKVTSKSSYTKVLSGSVRWGSGGGWERTGTGKRDKDSHFFSILPHMKKQINSRPL